MPSRRHAGDVAPDTCDERVQNSDPGVVTHDGACELADAIQSLRLHQDSNDESTRVSPEIVKQIEEAPNDCHSGDAVPEQLQPTHVLGSPDLCGVAKLILTGRVKRCIAMVGAGISVSAGIPDFRTPGTGLYDNLQQYGLPHPEAIFDIEFFQQNPKPFFKLAKELLPGNYQPTPTHIFLTLLHKKGLLHRCFTQNIDSLEVTAGLPRDVVVAAHGNFDTASCIDCSKRANLKEVLACLEREQVSVCKHCKGLVKPDIVFFGEPLPERFFQHCKKDLPKADLAIVMGTSLSVSPFASLPELVRSNCPRLLINREVVGDFDFDPDNNIRDALYEGDCDTGIMELVKLLGWNAEFQECLASQAE